MIMFDLPAIQDALRRFGLDGWLLYDFRGGNVLARRILDLDAGAMTTRRLFYAIPADGQPRKLVHRIEAGALDHLPGPKQVYLRWQELEAGVAELVAGMRRVAMEYSAAQRQPLRRRASTPARSSWCGASGSRSSPPATWSSSSRRPGTTTSGRCTWQAEAHTAVGLRRGLGTSSPSGRATAGRSARPRCRRRSWTTSAVTA